MTLNSTVLSNVRTGSIAALVALALSAPAQAASNPTDAWITTKVKISIATTEGVSATDVHVDTVGRQVTLHGTVRTASEKDIAERSAKAVEGTQSVRNLLQVVPEASQASVAEKDDVIHTHVSAALAGEASLKNSSITVQSVNKGVVLLKGNAATLSDHLNAVQVAGEVQGVRRVASEIQSHDTLADAEMWKEENVAVGGEQGTRSAARDLYTTSKVKMRLLANAETPAMNINVDTRVGVVTLFGVVPTAASKAAAETEAASVKGVASVKNQLQVVAAGRQEAVEARDDVIQGNVTKNLATHADLGQVASEVKNCVVRLTGTVATGTDRVEAMQVARATKGVCSVKDDLLVR